MKQCYKCKEEKDFIFFHKNKTIRSTNRTRTNCITFNMEFMKTPKQRMEQVKRIMRKLEKRGQNNEFINNEYKKLLKNEIF